MLAPVEREPQGLLCAPEERVGALPGCQIAELGGHGVEFGDQTLIEADA